MFISAKVFVLHCLPQSKTPNQFSTINTINPEPENTHDQKNILANTRSSTVAGLYNNSKFA